MNFLIRKTLLRFLREDTQNGDITGNLIPKNSTLNAKIISRQSAILAGIIYTRDLFRLVGCKTIILKQDGQKIKKNDAVLSISGSSRSVLSAERTALNLLSRMSGIATQTRHMVQQTRGRVKIYATRKTAPGLRFFDKKAVCMGGGFEHRMSLNDAILIKDNHLSILSMTELIKNAKKKYSKFEVEVETISQAITATKLGSTSILFDNFKPIQIKNTISKLEQLGLRKHITLEASGGINTKNLSRYVNTGIDCISVGELTHSVKGIDYSLEVV